MTIQVYTFTEAEKSTPFARLLGPSQEVKTTFRARGKTIIQNVVTCRETLTNAASVMEVTTARNQRQKRF